MGAVCIKPLFNVNREASVVRLLSIDRLDDDLFSILGKEAVFEGKCSVENASKCMRVQPS
eukprot:3511466-Pyramimonas_sp.AAC.1